ncbi:dsRBD fold-containing protein [Streptomyces sp. NPDC058783]|uniref:dsRBD fold-containing protein n=1 Tax=Streptomyces sp. NPDC058783 TaxID=3346633 RepID=UPI00369CF3CD
MSRTASATSRRRPRRTGTTAHRHPSDANVPEIGDDLAAGRGLRSIARQLLDIAERDIAATRATRPVSG